MFGIFTDEARKLLRQRGRWREVFKLRRWRQFFSVLRFNRRGGNAWKSEGEQAFKRREYSSYDEYVRHQQSKLQYLDLTDYERNYRRQLAERLREQSFIKKGSTALCLAARRGAEVRAFHDLGCFAVGVDLNPGPDNSVVLPGDFHRLEFPAESVDIVFTNSLDHAFDMEKLIGEIRRVLKPGGALVIEAILGEEKEITPDSYASFWWNGVDDLVAMFGRNGFEVLRRVTFAEPWPGEQICFGKPAQSVPLTQP